MKSILKIIIMCLFVCILITGCVACSDAKTEREKDDTVVTEQLPDKNGEEPSQNGGNSGADEGESKDIELPKLDF